MKKYTAGLALLAVACAPSDAVDSCPDRWVTSLGACCTPWTEPDENACRPRDWRIHATDVGDAGADALELVVDSDGRGLAAWVALGADAVSAQTVIAEELGPDWALQRPSIGLQGFTVQPTLAAGPAGRAVATWKQQDGNDGTIYVSERDDNGQWQHPTADSPLSFEPTAYEPRAAFSPLGELLVVWNQWTGTGYGVAVARRSSDDPDGELQRPQDASDVVSPDVNFSNAPQIAIADNGDAIIVWYQSPADDLHVFASERAREGGDFTRPKTDERLSPDGGPIASHPIRNPLAALSTTGDAAVVWTQENQRGDVPVFLATRPSRGPRPDGLGEWKMPESIDDAFSTIEGGAFCPQVAFGVGKELYVTWYQEADEGLRVHAAHRFPDGTWDDPEMLSSPGYSGIDPRLAIGPRGEAVIVFAENDGGPFRVVARRRNPDATRWGPSDVLSPDTGEDATDPVVHISPTGRTFAAWRQGPFLEAKVSFAVVD